MKHSLPLRAVLLTGACASIGYTQEILPSDGLRGDFFGYSVDIQQRQGIVGAPFHDAQGLSAGAAYIYQLDSGPFDSQESSKLDPLPDSGGACFGVSVAIEDEYAAVGAPRLNAAGSGSGQAYIFRDDNGAWEIDTILEASPASDRDRFGEAIDLDGRWLAVGAPRDDDRGVDAGAVYLYRRNGQSWSFSTKLTAPSTGPGDFFGFSLDLDGSRLVVGAYQNDLGTTNAGAVHVFLRTGNNWAPEATLLHPDPDLNDHLGSSVDMAGDLLIAGCAEDDDNGSQAGAALVWRRQGSVWSLVSELRASDGSAGDSFGHSVCVGPEGRLLVSAPNDDDFGFSSGGIYLFEPFGSAWVETLKHPFGEPDAGHFLGLDMAFDGEFAVVGSMFDDTLDVDAGAAKGMDVASLTSAWAVPGCFCDMGPCGNDDPNAGCANSTGQGALLTVEGSNSIAVDDLTFTVAPIAPFDVGRLIMGSDTSFAFFRDGLLCVNGGLLFGFGVVQADSAGIWTEGPGLAGASTGFGSSGAIVAGSTWHFQMWYRDLEGPCGNGTSLSNSMQVTFAP